MEIIENVFLFLWAFVKFIVFCLKTIFNLVWKTFDYIFGNDLGGYNLFDGIGDYFNNLSVYLGVYTIPFVGLFFLAFLTMFASFIYKFVKGNVSYKTALKKFTKK